MSFRNRLQLLRSNTWEIALATHLEYDVPNKTCDPNVSLTQRRAGTEQGYRDAFTERKGPLAGYNCYGHVLASRRTALYPNEGADIIRILFEDGYLEIDESQAALGDVVLYYDESGPNHIARVVRIDTTQLGLVANDEGAVDIPIVRSKFDDVSGEYEHNLADERWSSFSVFRRVYRPRGCTPRHKPEVQGWREAIAALDR